MDLYDYVGHTNPQMALHVIRMYGYQVDPQYVNVPLALRQLVTQEGEAALMDILEIHPDADLFEEYYQEKLNATGMKQPAQCGCQGCQQGHYNATGTTAAIISNQTNMATVLGAVVIAAAIIFTSKKGS